MTKSTPRRIILGLSNQRRRGEPDLQFAWEHHKCFMFSLYLGQADSLFPEENESEQRFFG
jgi:hypothetical protein